MPDIDWKKESSEAVERLRGMIRFATVNPPGDEIELVEWLAREVKEEGGAVPSVGGGKETILVVDDDDMIRKLAVRMLTEGGYAVLSAGGVAEAKQRIEEHTGDFDLVMTDVVMPESNGWVLVEWLARERPDIKVIVMSGLGERTLEGWDEGTVFQEKPFRQNNLLEKIRATLDA